MASGDLSANFNPGGNQAWSSNSKGRLKDSQSSRMLLSQSPSAVFPIDAEVLYRQDTSHTICIRPAESPKTPPEAHKADEKMGTTTTHQEESANMPVRQNNFVIQRNSNCIKQLYKWCAVAAALLILQVVSDSLSHQFRRFPTTPELCSLLLLSYPLALAATIYWGRRVGSYAPYLLGLGCVLMTCQLAWHWEHRMAHFKSSFLFEDLGQAVAPSSSTLSDRPPITVLYRALFGSSAADFLDTAKLLMVIFQNCLQSSIVCCLGMTTAIVVSGVQLVILSLSPLLVPSAFPAWVCRFTVTVIWTAHLIYSSYQSDAALMQQCRLLDDLQVAVHQSALEKQADSMLNHILKNNMADAMGCIEMHGQRPGSDEAGQLMRASDILFRGISWCKLREAMLRIIAGCYEGAACNLNIEGFCQDFVRGRNMELTCPSATLRLDPVACNIILDNAVTNALRHGCPNDAQVKLKVELPQDMGDDASDDGHLQSRSPAVRFLVTNKSNPDRPKLTGRWSSEGPSALMPPSHARRPALSDGLGLHHISVVAKACAMQASLWQEDETVLFELCVAAAVGTSGPDTPVGPAPCTLPPGLSILCLDDSAIARESLQAVLAREVPDAYVEAYGEHATDIPEFMRAALEHAHIIIVDQNVDTPGAEETKGSDVVKELRAKGYDGFACIRSGNAEEADEALSYASGAQWHVGKEVRLREIVPMLAHEYSVFQRQRNEMLDSLQLAMRSQVRPSDGTRNLEAPGQPHNLSDDCSDSSAVE